MKTTIATTIKEECKNTSDAMDRAAELNAEADQDWDNETTTFTFADGSQLAASGPDFWVVKNAAAVALGKLGGSVKTETKAKTSAANGAKGGRPQKTGNYYYQQLCGALSMLKDAGENLPWAEIDENLRKIAADNGPHDCDIDEIKAMHRQYRDRCLRLKLLNPGELFNSNDCRPLI